MSFLDIPLLRLRQYTDVKLEGEYAWCTLYRALNKQGEAVVIKKARDTYADEAKALAYCKHRHVVRCIESFFPYIVLESGTEDLFNHVTRRGPLPEANVKWIAIQLATALDYMHTTLNVSHGDISAENVIFTDAQTVKLIDFATLHSADEIHPVTEGGHGKLLYDSWEAQTQQVWKESANDCHAFAVLLLVCLTASLPHRICDFKRDPWYNALWKGGWSKSNNFSVQQLLGHLSPECEEVFQHLFCPEATRWTMAHILKSKWLSV
jgi:serine/threonine protein kinase